MALKKSAKRKRSSHIQNTQDISKIDLAVSHDDSGPINLHTVISQEEVEIASETLTTLAKFPKLIKSKQCKDLRVAAYDFRQSCTAGVSLTARVTAAINDEKYLDARILLAEMRLRNQEPKLGTLCRWVRDLDVVSRPHGKIPDSQGLLPKDRDLLALLDAVMRVSCPVDTKAPPPLDFAPHMSLQTTWNLRPSSAPAHQVYASVLDKSIFVRSREAAVASSLRIIETTPGHLRKPPNHHPAILYASKSNMITLSDAHGPVTCHSHPSVPNLTLMKNVLTPDECKAIVATGETVGFLPDEPLRDRDGGGDTSVLAHNLYWIIDTDFHDALWARVSAFLPQAIDGRRVRGLNRRFRVYRYVPGAEYRSHIDGAWPPSGITAADRYVYDDSPPDGRQSSLLTFLLYLNDEFDGGETVFFLPSPFEGVLNAYPVRPVMGAIAIFPHGETRGALLHEGTGVTMGAKYIIRTDVEYDVEPSVK